MEFFSENTQIGDYILLQCLRETPEIRTWSAKQVSVGRSVLIDEYTEDGAVFADDQYGPGYANFSAYPQVLAKERFGL